MKGFVAILLAFVLAGLAAWYYFAASEAEAPAQMTDAEYVRIQAEVEQAIADRWAGFSEVVLAEDYDGWTEFWRPDARVLQPGMDLSGGALFDFAKDLFDSGVDFHTLDMTSSELFVHGSTAYQIGHLDETATMGTGEGAEWHDHLFVRWVMGDDGKWRISHLLGGPRDAPPEG